MCVDTVTVCCHKINSSINVTGDDQAEGSSTNGRITRSVRARSPSAAALESAASPAKVAKKAPKKKAAGVAVAAVDQATAAAP